MNTEIKKACSDCKKEKSLNSFTVKKRGLYGRDSICKECYCIRAKIHYKRNKKRKGVNYPTEKYCPKCDSTKPIDDWAKNKGSKDGLQSYCKECLNKIKKTNRKNKEFRRKEEEYRKSYHSKPSTKRRFNDWRKDYKETNPSYKLAHLERSRVYHALKAKNASTNLRQDERLGCSIAEFRTWLESQFKDGMTWENHGLVWHVDHIKPLSWFDLTDENQQKEAFHYTNQQPLFKEENWSKNNRFIG